MYYTCCTKKVTNRITLSPLAYNACMLYLDLLYVNHNLHILATVCLIDKTCQFANPGWLSVCNITLLALTLTASHNDAIASHQSALPPLQTTHTYWTAAQSTSSCFERPLARNVLDPEHIGLSEQHIFASNIFNRSRPGLVY